MGWSVGKRSLLRCLANENGSIRHIWRIMRRIWRILYTIATRLKISRDKAGFPPAPAEPAVSVARVSDLTASLREHFGFPAFRPGQREACQAALAGPDLLVVMPTGP